MNILIVKLSAIGDVLHTLPALNALRHTFPQAHITWLVEEAAAGIIAGHSELARVLVSRRRQWAAQLKAGSPLAAFREFYQFIQELRAVSYDLIIDFQGLLKSVDNRHFRSVSTLEPDILPEEVQSFIVGSTRDADSVAAAALVDRRL